MFSFFFPCSDSCEAGETTKQLPNTSKLVSYLKWKFSPLWFQGNSENFSLPTCPLCLVTDKRQDFELVPWVLRSSSCLNSLPEPHCSFSHGMQGRAAAPLFSFTFSKNVPSSVSLLGFEGIPVLKACEARSCPKPTLLTIREGKHRSCSKDELR